MICITQLVYIKEGQENVFDKFESIAIPVIAQYGGRLLLRIRPKKNAVIENKIEVPSEFHLIEFADEERFKSFVQDEERKRFLHLKEQSIKITLLIKGEKI